MSEHQITDLLNVSMEKIKEMLKVGMIVGDPIYVGEEVIIPVSKVKCGFVSGGMDYKLDVKEKYPFGGATAGTVSLSPVAFLTYNNKEVKVLHLTEESHILEKMIDGTSELLSGIFKNNKEEKTR